MCGGIPLLRGRHATHAVHNRMRGNPGDIFSPNKSRGSLHNLASTLTTSTRQSLASAGKAVGVWRKIQLVRYRIGKARHPLPNPNPLTTTIDTCRPHRASTHQQRHLPASTSFVASPAPSIPSASMGPKVDIITLGDFRDKQPEWSPDRNSHLFAVVDMGR